MTFGRQDRLRFPKGNGRYVADLFDPTTLHVAFLRSPVARGRIDQLDLDSARSFPGTVTAVGAAEAGAELRPLTLRYGPGETYPWDVFPAEWTSYVGEPLAAVVAGSRAAAENAVELIDLDIDSADPVLSPHDALGAESPIVRPEVGTNLAFSLNRGTGDVSADLAQSALVLTKSFHAGRKSAFPLEPRGVLAWVEPHSGQLVVVTSTQSPHIARTALARALGRAEHSVRVIAPDVGGGFGLKAHVYVEEIVVAWLAIRLGRRVGWLEDRWENLVAGYHSHDERVELTGGFNADGTIRAMDVRVTCDIGAHSCYPLSAALIPSTVAGHMFGPYRVPAMNIVAKAVYTNKTPSGAYRGVGAPAGTFAAERLLDLAADALGIDRVDIRTRNLVTARDLPHEHPSGSVYLDTDPANLFRTLLDTAREEQVPTAASSPADRPSRSGTHPVIGVGMAVYNEHSGPGSAAYRARGTDEVPGYDSTKMVLSPDGRVIVYLSSADAGQDHVATCKMEVARVLRIDPEMITVIEGDTEVCPPGTGTFASRFAPAQLASAVTSAVGLRSRIETVAAELLNCSVEELSSAEGGGYQPPNGAPGLGIEEIARRAYLGEGVASDGLPIEAAGYWDAKSKLPWGAMLAVVELDARFFTVTVKKVVAVENCGRVLNRASVMEQLRGGIIMGMGDALYEEHHVAESGDLLTASLLDYLLPLADAIPEMKILIVDEIDPDDVSVPGRGIGEAGCIGGFAAIGCAIADATRQLGGELNALPGSPRRIFESLV
jgi:carbon-monoxide dehydrogenase large subunit